MNKFAILLSASLFSVSFVSEVSASPIDCLTRNIDRWKQPGDIFSRWGLTETIEWFSLGLYGYHIDTGYSDDLNAVYLPAGLEDDIISLKDFIEDECICSVNINSNKTNNWGYGIHGACSSVGNR